MKFRVLDYNTQQGQTLINIHVLGENENSGYTLVVPLTGHESLTLNGLKLAVALGFAEAQRRQNNLSVVGEAYREGWVLDTDVMPCPNCGCESCVDFDECGTEERTDCNCLPDSCACQGSKSEIECYYCDETVEEERANNEGWLWGRIRGQRSVEAPLTGPGEITLMPVPPACPRHVESLRLMLTAVRPTRDLQEPIQRRANGHRADCLCIAECGGVK